ncbi:MAG: hypothetical protein ACRC15_00190, partial [Cetobacterium sp.]
TKNITVLRQCVCVESSCQGLWDRNLFVDRIRTTSGVKDYHGKLKIEDSWARNMFIMLNMDYCLSAVTLEGQRVCEESSRSSTLGSVI